jgi:hypothetical protein
MKKLIQAATILSAGAAVMTSSHLLAAPGGGKPWTFSLGLRGFYDDNIFTGNNNDPADQREVSSWGFEITPGLRLDLPLSQGLFTASYNYGFRYFEDRPGTSYDQFHIGNVELTHNFSPRLKLNMFNNLAIAQEPEQIGGGSFLRAEGNNLRNAAGISLEAQLTPLWSGVLGYNNNLYDYDFAPFAFALNRMEHLPYAAARYHLSSKTILGMNYQYGITEYSNADFRDMTSHYIFGSVDHTFNSRLTGSLRGGIQLVDWSNPPAGAARDSASNPYFDANLTYVYMEGSNAQLGVKHARNATDVTDLLFGMGADAIYDQESTFVYGSINHAFTGKLRASLSGQYQNSAFVASTRGSSLDDMDEHYYNVGVTLNYRLTQYMAAEVAYFFDRLTSDIDFRNYDRNRVFFGVRMTY